ncbi:TetR/AcrR family transcriptional regulator [Paenibacillus sp. LjRoot153]|uniref:TetR/AcrR family transcriptional regulator n=1 Tax=Paenibacillus sp. LjRoot153 TaxID=3342270 RepID=UPI003ED07D69
MVGIKNNRRTKYTIDLIKETFIKLLETKKLAQITATEICKLADINRGTFYLHYKDPFELFEVMQDEFNQEVMATLETGESTCTTEESLVNLLHIIQAKKTMYKILISERENTDFLSQVLLADYVRRNGKGVLTMDYSFTYKVHGSIGVINQWLGSNSDESPRTIAYLISSMGNHNTTEKGLS